MRAFLIVWLGQVVSLFGTAMTRFALTLWAWQITGQATSLALVSFFGFIPELLFTPLAGPLIDRWNRKWVMMISDLTAGVATLALLVLYTTGHLEIWHVYVAAILEGAGASFQFPAYTAAISTMIPKAQLGRVNGLMGLVDCLPGILAPLVAGALIIPLGLGGILAIDVVTFIIALGALLIVPIPQPATTLTGEQAKGSLRQEMLYGFRYIWQRPGLRYLQVIFLWAVAAHSFERALIAPMVLARTGNNAAILAGVASATAAGEVAGGVLMSIWGGPRRRIHGVLIGWAGLLVVGGTVFALGQSQWVWLIAAFVSTLLSGLIGCTQAIWQTKVAPDVQGKVFSARRLTELLGAPLAVLCVGPLADRFFEPGLQPGGNLVPLLGGLFGTGPGAGLAALLAIGGLVGGLATIYGYLTPAVRNIETDLPDHI